MFKVSENYFEKEYKIKYIDEYNNKLMIIMEINGTKSNIRIKLRPAKENVKVDRIVLAYPFSVEGINFNARFTPEEKDYVNSKEFESILEEVIYIVQRWFEILGEVASLTNNDIPLTEEEVNTILISLEKKEETKDFADKYRKLLKLYDAKL